MDIRPELGRENPGNWGGEEHLFRGRKIYSNAPIHGNYTIDMYGQSPEEYRDRLQDLRKEVEEKTYGDSGTGKRELKGEAWEKVDKDEVERWLDMNNSLAWDDPASPMQRMNQPMGSNISTNWKNDNGNYMPALAFRNALLDDKTGGSFKNTLKNQGPADTQAWLNNHHGGRGLGYMGQNKFHRQPSAYGPGTTYNMDERKANVQANALRFFRSRGYRV